MIDRYARPDMKRVWSDEHKYDLWLRVEIAACEAWADDGMIPPDDMEKLRSARHDLGRIEEIFDRTRHDMTAFTRSITEGLGAEGRWIHLGLTSNDVIDTAQNLQLVEGAELLQAGVAALREAVRARAVEFKHTPTVGRTHGVHAEPTTFGLKLAVWWEELGRAADRLEDAKREIAVGKLSGAVGTFSTLSPEMEGRVCARLGLRPAPISTQVVQRDRHARFVTTLALIAASLEKFATEVRHLQRTEVREAEEPFGEGQTGSSAMPHKRNPELSERVCGLARLIRGHAVTALENVALWHERDISHSSAERLILPDSCMALDYILDIFTGVVSGLRVYPDRMWANLEATHGLLFSQRVLTALIEGGMSRERAYGVIQDQSLRSWDTGDDFRDLLRGDAAVAEVVTPEELEGLFDYRYHLRHVDAIFDRLGLG